jgi:hypothetical protein
MSRVSIVVTNYNYETFLGPCLDSALAQDHPNTEVIVVDDGSTDCSADVIERYGTQITAIFQPNGGQGSAFNTGFARSTGEVVIFLDADDLLDVEAASAAAAMLSTPGVVKAHWSLREIDGAGAETGRLVPGRGLDLPEGDLRDEVFVHGPATMRFPPTSGNAWARGFLQQVLPMDEAIFRIGADTLLFEVAPFVGAMARDVEPRGSYRAHGSNKWRTLSFRAQVEHEHRFYDECVRVAEAVCAADSDHRVDTGAWRRFGWWPRLDRATTTIEETVADGKAFVLLDDAAWGMASLGERRAVPFPATEDGQWAGVPGSEAEADAALDAAVAASVEYFVVGWNARWWLDEFEGLASRLGEPVVSSADVDIYALSMD